MNRKIFIAGAFFGLIAIILGAFATHGLKPRLSADSLASFETGVKYQMYSAFFLLFLGLFPMVSENNKKLCFYLTVAGVVLFSGSVFLLATNTLTTFDFTVIAPVTPVGGSLLIIAWVVVLVRFFKLKKK